MNVVLKIHFVHKAFGKVIGVVSIQDHEINEMWIF